MSAFIVPRAHVAALVLFLAQDKYAKPEDRGEGMTTNADMLMQENVRSVNHRYAHHDDPASERPYTTSEVLWAPKLSPVAILKACDSLEYQSCENEDYRTTPAFDLLDRIRGAAIHRLPGYEDAEWVVEPAPKLVANR